MTDYASMTNEDLNRAVAEAMGWTDFEFGSYFVEDWCQYDFVHCWFGTPPGGKSRPLYDWATSIDAAAALDFGRWTVEITFTPSGEARVVADTDVKGEIVITNGTRDNLARAIAECWLAYREAVKAIADK